MLNSNGLSPISLLTNGASVQPAAQPTPNEPSALLSQLAASTSNLLNSTAAYGMRGMSIADYLQLKTLRHTQQSNSLAAVQNGGSSLTSEQHSMDMSANGASAQLTTTSISPTQSQLMVKNFGKNKNKLSS